MPSTPRSSTPIMSAAELSVWWAEVLSESEVDTRQLSMMWLDGQGRMLARVLSLDGVPPLPHPTVVQAVLQIHGVFAERPEAAGCHLAFALSRLEMPRSFTRTVRGRGPRNRDAGTSSGSVDGQPDHRVGPDVAGAGAPTPTSAARPLVRRRRGPP